MTHSTFGHMGICLISEGQVGGGWREIGVVSFLSYAKVSIRIAVLLILIITVDSLGRLLGSTITIGVDESWKARREYKGRGGLGKSNIMNDRTKLRWLRIGHMDVLSYIKTNGMVYNLILA